MTRALLRNFVLFAGVVLLAQHLMSVWQTFDQSNQVEDLLTRLPNANQESTERMPSEEISQALPEFMVIADRNLFLPERRSEEEKTVEMETTAPSLPKKPDLSAVYMVGDKLYAMLTVYGGKRNKGKSRVVGLGDQVQGYVVSEIRDTTLTLSWNSEEVLIDMADVSNSQQARSAAGKIFPVTVVTIGAAAQAVQVTTATETAAKQEKRTVQVGAVGTQQRPGLAGSRGLSQAGSGRAGLGGQRGRGRRGLGSGRGRRMGGAGGSSGIVGTSNRRTRGMSFPPNAPLHSNQ